MKRTFTIIKMIGILVTCCRLQSGFGQEKISVHMPDSSHVQVLEMKNGSIFHGRITAIMDQAVQFTTDQGVLHILIDDIASLEDISSGAIKEGVAWFPNPNRTRLFFAPKADMVPSGKGYYQNIFIFFNSVVFGVSDNVTLGFGGTFFPTGDITNQLYYLLPKIGIKATDTFKLAAGALLAFVPGEGGSLGILYGVGTIGSSENNISAGFGYGFESGDLAEKPLVMIGGETRIAKGASLVTENWLIPGMNGPLISGGIRLFGKKIAVDLAIVAIIDLGYEPITLPYVDFILNF